MFRILSVAAVIVAAASASAMDLEQAKMVTFGDSITAGMGVSEPERYASLLARDSGGTLENRAISGQTACMMSVSQVFSKPVPSPANGSHYATMMIGTNDSNIEGLGPYESIHRMCLRGSLTWLTIPEKKKALPRNGRCTTAGAWVADAKSPLEGLVSNASGDEMNCQLDTTGGSLFIWFEASDASAGVFSYSIDGGPKRKISVRSRTPIRMRDGRGLTGGATLEIVNLPAGSHVVRVVNETAAGTPNASIKIYGIGTPSRDADALRLFVGGTPFQRFDRKSQESRKYFEIAREEVAKLKANGLPLEFVDTRAFMRGTQAELYDDLHPNALGQSELRDAFESEIARAQ